jgi:3-oxoacyl-[acyl-carrier-protein] synthase-3
MYLGCISYHLGTPHDLDTLRAAAPADVQPVIDGLRAAGFVTFRRADVRVWEAAYEAASASLRQLDALRREVDLVLYATNSFDPAVYRRDDLDRLMVKLDLPFVRSQIVSGGDCANLGVALGVAQRALAYGEAETVLLISADGAPSEDYRITQPPIAVLSDGAAACVLSSQAEGASLQVRSVNAVFDHGARFQDSGGDFTKLIRITSAGVRRARARLTDEMMQTFAVILTNNTSEDFTRLTAMQLKVSRSRIADANRAVNGHVYSADVLINCAAYLQAGTGEGEPILLFSNGIGAWSVVDCVRVGDQRGS